MYYILYYIIHVILYIIYQILYIKNFILYIKYIYIYMYIYISALGMLHIESLDWFWLEHREKHHGFSWENRRVSAMEAPGGFFEDRFHGSPKPIQ